MQRCGGGGGGGQTGNASMGGKQQQRDRPMTGVGCLEQDCKRLRGIDGSKKFDSFKDAVEKLLPFHVRGCRDWSGSFVVVLARQGHREDDDCDVIVFVTMMLMFLLLVVGCVDADGSGSAGCGWLCCQCPKWTSSDE